MKGTISLTFHEVDSETAHKLLAAMRGDNDKQLDLDLAPAPVVEKAPEPAPAVAATPEPATQAPPKAAPSFPPTADEIGQMKDRKALIALIAKLSDADEEDVADHFKGRRVTTLRKEAISQLEVFMNEDEDDDVIDVELVGDDSDVSIDVDEESEDEESEDEESEFEESEDEESEDEESEDEEDGGGFYSLKDLPKSITGAHRLRDVIKAMVADGLDDPDVILAECSRLAASVPAINSTRSWDKRVKVVCKRLGV